MAAADLVSNPTMRVSIGTKMPPPPTPPTVPHADPRNPITVATTTLHPNSNFCTTPSPRKAKETTFISRNSQWQGATKTERIHMRQQKTETTHRPDCLGVRSEQGRTQRNQRTLFRISARFVRNEKRRDDRESETRDQINNESLGAHVRWFPSDPPKMRSFFLSASTPRYVTNSCGYSNQERRRTRRGP